MGMSITICVALKGKVNQEVVGWAVVGWGLVAGVDGLVCRWVGIDGEWWCWGWMVGRVMLGMVVWGVFDGLVSTEKVRNELEEGEQKARKGTV